MLIYKVIGSSVNFLTTKSSDKCNILHLLVIFVRLSGGNAIQTANLNMEQKISVGDKVTFDSDKIEAFKEDTKSQEKSIRQYRELVLAGINEIGTVQEIGLDLITVIFSDGWVLPLPRKYILVLPPM